MSKKSVINRNLRREKLVEKYKVKRQELKRLISTPSTDPDTKADAIWQLSRLPRDSSKVRVRNRCVLTGRPRGVYKQFGISRTKLREAVMNGYIPGVTKSSW